LQEGKINSGGSLVSEGECDDFIEGGVEEGSGMVEGVDRL